MRHTRPSLAATGLIAGALLLRLAAQSAPPPQAPAPSLNRLVRAYLWPASDAERREAEAALTADRSLAGVDRMRFHELEAILRHGPPVSDRALDPPPAADRAAPEEITVEVPGGARIRALVRLPPSYAPAAEWPLMFAMHGGPPGTVDQARAGAERMLRVWSEAAAAAGWIVAAPAMTTVVSVDRRTEERLPYEIFHPEQARAVIAALRTRYRINPDRIVSTGISLGSNFSIAFAAAHPDWFAAIVPVSTEGESRERLLRNIAVPVYVLEGAQDRNIRGIAGPRALAGVLQRFGYDLTYREFGERAHEGFQEHYGDVLRWLDGRPRQLYPREVLRVPHPGIVPPSRRVHWIESDTRQAVIRAGVASPGRIEIAARWARELKIFLHDRLVDLDRPIEIRVNGVSVFAGQVARSIPFALAEARALGDERRVYAAVVTVKVPTTPAAMAAGERLWNSLAPRQPEEQLSFWEMYATRALEERFPTLGFEGVLVAAPAGAGLAGEQQALRVARVQEGSAVAEAGLRANDLLLEFGGEPFFCGTDERDRGAPEGSARVTHAALYAWLVRELRAEPRDYPLIVWRDGRRVTLKARMGLGEYRSRTSTAGDSRIADCGLRIGN